MGRRTRDRRLRLAVGPMVAASVAGVMAAPAQAREADRLAIFLAPAPGERVLMTGPSGEVGEVAFWRWAGTSGLGPRELARAGLNGAELLELVCQFADDIDFAQASPAVETVDSGQALVDRAAVERAIVRRGLEARPLTEPPALPEDQSARPECVLAPEPGDVAAMLAEAPGAAPYILERRLRQTVRRTSTIRILGLPDAQHRGGDAP